MQLKNARILLTGASGGLGHELASQLTRLPVLPSCSPDATSAGSTECPGDGTAGQEAASRLSPT
jgi:NAD(P)-dependent dehydrogenase (short-subunit alcohol dehydrogenase family)